MPLKNESNINNFLFSRHKVRYHLLKQQIINNKSYTLPPDNVQVIIFTFFSYVLSMSLN